MSSHKIDIPTIPASLWNETMDVIARRLPINFESFHQIWQHPWTVSPFWFEDEKERIKEWRFKVAPGFVNGLHYECDIKPPLASARTIERLEVGGKKVGKEEVVTAWGIESPTMRVDGTRVIGSGSDPTGVSVTESGDLTTTAEAVPKFFQKLGVGKEVQLAGNLTSGIQEVVQEEQKDPRILRAFDIVMRLDRIALRVETGDIEVAAIGGFTQLLSIAVGRSSPANPSPTIYQTSKYVAPPPSNPADLFEGIGDREYDELKVATVFFLSPPETTLDEPLDGSWTPYVRHDLFWNLAYLPATIPTALDSTPITIRTGLAGGIGDAIGNQILSPLNDAYAEAVTRAKARSLEGSFWTV